MEQIARDFQAPNGPFKEPIERFVESTKKQVSTPCQYCADSNFMKAGKETHFPSSCQGITYEWVHGKNT